jgi:hypothetical protein
MQTVHDKRTFELTVIPSDFPAVEADLIRRGFDGRSYVGESEGTGRQHVRVALFYRQAADGAFVNALGS